METDQVRDFEKKMFERYPVMFSEYVQRVGFSCGDGWNLVLERLFNAMSTDTPPITINQVKEKFGGLRVYYSGGSTLSTKALRFAEETAAGLCEVCGKSGFIRDDLSWLRVLCNKHHEEKASKDA